jgi:hypothetical protein
MVVSQFGCPPITKFAKRSLRENPLLITLQTFKLRRDRGILRASHKVKRPELLWPPYHGRTSIYELVIVGDTDDVSAHRAT